ncbi:MAG: MATE family efflux transporter [Eubacteriales bacterium]|nr:MATE family efflux transporter [Eubacteriales bacterium]
MKSADKSFEKKEVNMLSGPLLGKILLFCMPLAASSMLQQLFNSADTAVAGRFASAQDMSAVGANAPVISLLISLFVGLSIGGNVLIARYIGQRHREKINPAIGTILFLAFISGLLMMGICFLLAPLITRMMNTPDDVLPLAVLYLRIYSIGLPFVFLYNFSAAILRSKGDSQRPFLVLLFAGILNVGLNLFLVIVFHMGVAGVAIATVLSNIISSGMILRFLIHGEENFRLEKRYLKIHREVLVFVLKIGLPAGLQGIVFSLSNVIIQTALNSFGSIAVAGSVAAMNFEYLCYYSVNAFNQAATTFNSQNFAAGKIKRCRKIFKICVIGGILSCTALNFLFFGFHRAALSLFSADPRVLHYAFLRMRHVLIFQGIAAIYEVTASFLRGMGHSLSPSLITVLGSCVFRIIWVYSIFPLSGNYTSLMAVYPTSWILTSLMMLACGYYYAKKELRIQTQ